MNIRHKLGVFMLAARLGFKEVFADGLILFGSFLTYTVVVVSYSSVFRGISADDLIANNLTLSEMIRYICATEFVLFCGSAQYFKELQYDIQNDQIHLSLLRPCFVWVVRIGEWFGQAAARVLVLFVPCVILTGLMVGNFNLSFGQLIGFIASIPMACLLLICFHFMLGASCLWLNHSEPAYWIWQKCLFFFGALLWPLALYPKFLQNFAWFTPFPSILAVPAHWTSNINVLTMIGGFAHQIFWAVVCLVLVACVHRVMFRYIQDSGE